MAKKKAKRGKLKKNPSGGLGSLVGGAAGGIGSALAELGWKRVGLGAGGLVGFIAVVVGLLAGVHLIQRQAEATLIASGEREVVFDWPPLRGDPSRTWLPESDKRSLERQARAALKVDRPLSSEPLERLSASMSRSGWFDGVVRVRRTTARRIEIDATWRVPEAVVRAGGMDHVISSNRYPMPPTFAAGTDHALPAIVGAAQEPTSSTDPRDKYASPWPGVDVQHGLELIRLLKAEPPLAIDADGRAVRLIDQVAAVDVSGASRGDKRLVLRTPDDTRVVWGSPVGVFAPGQVPAEQRVAHLRALYRDSNRIDAGLDSVEVFRTRVLYGDVIGSPTPPGGAP